MKLFVSLILIISQFSFAQVNHWLKIIPNTKVEIKYYSPEKTGKYKPLKRIREFNTELGSYQSFSDQYIKVNLTFRNYPDFIQLTGETDNLSKNDLCFTIKLIFPFSWEKDIYWNNDPDRSVLVRADSSYENFVEAKTVISPDGAFDSSANSNGGYGDNVGTGKMSFYPFASVSAPSYGLGWGIDLGLPIVYRLKYKSSEGMVTEFDIATAEQTAKFPNSAFFKLQLFENKPEWHFRAALDKYYKINQVYFKKRVNQEGIWLPFTPLNTIKDYQDFGFAFHETDWRAKDKEFNNAPTIDADKQGNIYSFQYTEPWDIQIPIRSGDLDYKDVVSDKIIPQRDSEFLQTSATLDKDNLWQARKLKTPWFNTGWAVSITTNADPAIPGYNKYDFVRDEEIDPAIKLNVDGIYFDSMEWNWHYDLNYNRKQFTSTNFPLTFSSSLINPKPAIWNYSSEYEMMKKVASEMHLRGKLTMGNGFAWLPFAPGILDLFGSEFNWYSKEESGEKRFRFIRAISYQKPIVFLLNEGLDDKEFTSPPYTGYTKYFEKMLFYGFFPSFFSVNSSSNPYWEDSARYNTGRPFFKKYIPLIKLISASGWEPVTYATAKNVDLPVERFGNDIKKGLYFTIYNNRGTEKRIILNIDAGSLKLKDVRKIKDLISGTIYPFSKDNNNIILRFTIPPGRTKLMEIF